MYLHRRATKDPVFTDVLKLDLAQVEPSLAGPKRPQDRVPLKDVKTSFASAMDKEFEARRPNVDKRVPVEAARRLTISANGDVVIAAITSCTNTSNPSVMIGAGLLARKARGEGPYGEAVGEDLAGAGLAGRRRNILRSPVCRRISTSSASISSASAAPPASATPVRCRRKFRRRSTSNDLVAAAVLSGNRNFEGRVERRRARELSRVAAAGRRLRDRGLDAVRSRQAAARRRQGRQEGLPEGHLADHQARSTGGDPQERSPRRCSRRNTPNVFKGDANWRKVPSKGGLTYAWDNNSTYVQNPPYFVGMQHASGAARGHRRRARAGPVPRLDHDRPHLAGGFDQADVAGGQLPRSITRCRPADFNQYGTRRGNHEVMMRGTFANIRIKNQMVPGVEGGVTIHYPSTARR